MKFPPSRHRWNLSPREAIRLQGELAREVSLSRLTRRVRYIAGADMAFSPDKTRCLAGVVIYDLEQAEIVEHQFAWKAVHFPYVPGLLSFREAPAVLAAIRKLKIEPDLFMFDGQGIAHPRRFGLASHVGLLIDKPSIGCAKSRLCGQHDEPGEKQGERATLTYNGETIGAVLRTRDHVKPLYISPGHRVTLDDAIRMVLKCSEGFRLPEPTRQADRLVSRHRHGT